MKKPQKDFFEKTGATKDAPVILPGGAGGRSKNFISKSNFELAKKKLEETGKLDLEFFNNTEDVGLFIDWYNKGVKDSKEAAFTREVLEISKFLVRTVGRKTFIIGDK